MRHGELSVDTTRAPVTLGLRENMVACCNRMRQCDERSQKRDLRRDSIEEGDASCETRNDRLHTAKYRHRKRRMRGGERRRARYRLKQAVFSPTMYAIAADMIPMMVPHHEPEKPAAPNGKAGFQAWNTVPSFSRQQHLTERQAFWLENSCLCCSL